MKKLEKTKKVAKVCLILLLCILLSGCGDSKVIEGIEYGTHRLFNQDEKKNPNIQYELVWGNIIWGTILCQTLIAPVYFFGFSIWEPVGKKTKIVK